MNSKTIIELWYDLKNSADLTPPSISIILQVILKPHTINALYLSLSTLVQMSPARLLASLQNAN